MIERLLYGRSLPTLYEVKLSAGKGSEEPLVLSSAQLGGRGDSREESLYAAVKYKAENEGIEIDYSLSLMRPGETRRYLKPKIWRALGKTAEESFVNLMPIKTSCLVQNHLAVLESTAGLHEG